MKTLKILTSAFIVMIGLAINAMALPTVHDIWEATQRGDFAAAERMCNQVLQTMPNSAKAHYVYANVLAMEGQMSIAKTQLNIAESLDPSDSFATSSSIQKLRSIINPPTY